MDCIRRLHCAILWLSCEVVVIVFVILLLNDERTTVPAPALPTLTQYRCEFFSSGAVTSQSTAGRLGNAIFEYASVWCFARRHRVAGYVQVETLEQLEPVFDALDLGRLQKLPLWYCEHARYDTVLPPALGDVVALAKRTRRMIVLPMFFKVMQLLTPCLEELRHALPYKPHLVQQAAVRLATVRTALRARPGLQRAEVVFVGVHIRRSDYTKHLRAVYNTTQLAPARYYRRAATWMRTALGDGSAIAFVLASDDPWWCHHELIPLLHEDLAHKKCAVFYAGSDSPETDLALLSTCNHSIIDYGTFGMWAALLTGGRTAVFDLGAAVGNDSIETPAMAVARTRPLWTVL